MSRYCNDFASDLRLFIYSPAVLADRKLITGASRYTNGIKVPAPAHTQCALNLSPLLSFLSLSFSSSPPRLRLCGELRREFRGRVSYGGDLSSTRSRRWWNVDVGNPREFLVPLKNRSFDKWLLARETPCALYIAAVKNVFFYRAHATNTSYVLRTLSFWLHDIANYAWSYFPFPFCSRSPPFFSQSFIYIDFVKEYE